MAAYLWCLFSESFYYAGSEGAVAHYPGFGLLALGWLAIGDGGHSWLGNPLLLAAWITLFTRKQLLACFLAICAVGFMLSFTSETHIAIDEAGHERPITALGRGYWLWVLSASLVVVQALISWVRGDGD